MKKVIDRNPQFPNRKKITYENGRVEFAKIEYADEPVEKGTPINHALFGSIEGDISRIDKYSKPKFKRGLGKGKLLKNGDFINLWGNSHYQKYGILISASTEEKGFEVYKSMNGVEGYWQPTSIPTVATPALYTLEFYRPMLIKKFKIAGVGNQFCKTFTLQGSNDGDVYFDIQTIENNTAAETEYSNNNEQFFKFYRLSITESGTEKPAIYYFNVTEWIEAEEYNLINLQDIPTTEYVDNHRLLLDLEDDCTIFFGENVLPPFMKTSENGYLVQSSGDYVNTSVVDMFDYDNDFSYWRSLDTQLERYVQITMPLFLKAEVFAFKCSNIANGKILGSNNGDDWEVLAENIATTDGTKIEALEVQILEPKKFRFYKFTFNAKVENTSSYIYTFGIVRGYQGNLNYSAESYIDINNLGKRIIQSESIIQEGNYEFVYDLEKLSYKGYLNSFSRASVENQFTEAEKIKLAGIEVGAEVNVIDGAKVNGEAVKPDKNRIIDIHAIPPEAVGEPFGVAGLNESGKLFKENIPDDINASWETLKGKPNILTTLTDKATDQDLVSAKCLYNLIGTAENQLSQI